MGRDKIRYYVVKANGFAHWIPNQKMKDAGFQYRSLGKASPKTEDIARALNREWDAHRTGMTIEARPQIIPGSLADAFDRLKTTSIWKDKSIESRTEWDRAWRRIDPIFGDVDPRTVSLEDITGFRDVIRDTISVSEAHRTIKIWRALWKKAAAMKFCDAPGDPSQGFENTAPKKRKAMWEYSEVRALAKHAWRMGYPQITAGLSVMWDTLLSPVDVRLLRYEQMRMGSGMIWFEIERQKTGKTAYATLSGRSIKVLQAYLDTLGNVKFQPDAPLLRDVTGKPLDKNRFGKLFRRVRDDLLPGDTRVMADIRRSGSVEAIRGGAAAEGLSAKLANTLSHSNFLYATYVPDDLEPIRTVDKARQTARKKNANSTESLTEPAKVRLFPKR